jgi:acyl-CoA reductase-like NAD-dependent aldehyde dehydrogenase
MDRQVFGSDAAEADLSPGVMMRHFPLLALGALALLVPGAHAREQQDLRERVRDAVQRTDKDLGNFVHRDKLNEQQRDRFDAAIKDLRELREAVAGGRWEGERERLERAIDNIDFVAKHAPIDEGDRQTLGIDLYTLRVILDSWQP